jgi:phosphonate transport system ATP-binding protein
LDALHDHFDTVVLAMHDVELALRYSSRIIGLKQGRIAFDRPSAGLGIADLDFLYGDSDAARR